MAAVHPEKLALTAFDDQLYRLIAETIPHMVWTADAQGGAEYFNRRTYDYTGLDFEALSGSGWTQVVHPDDIERCVAAWSHAQAHGERFEFEYRLRRADGAYRWHHASAEPLRGPGGRVFRWFGTVTDVDAEVRGAHRLESMVEERTRALREAQSRLRALIDNEPECVKLLDAGGHLLEMNAAGLRMIEADSPEGVLGTCVYGFVAPEHAAAFRGLTERVCRGERGTLEFELVGMKGTRLWLETHAVPFRDETSGETRLLAVTRDVTDRRRAQDALRESEQRFQAFMENLPGVAWIRGADFRYTYVNRRYAAIWGLAPDQLIGRDPAQLFPPETARYFRETERDVVLKGGPVQFVDGLPSGRWLKMKFPVPDGAGGTGVAGIGLDISQRERLEEALRESEQRFRTFMANTPARAWIKDSKLRYTFINRAFETEHELAGREVVGHDDFELFPRELAQYFRHDDEQVLKAGRAVQKLRELPPGQQRRGHWMVVKFPLADASGAMGIGGISIDVSARVEAEESARHHAEHVRELVSRLVQAQEAERRKVADELHDLIGQNLTALGIDLQALKQRLQSGGDTVAAPRLDAMAALLDSTIDAIRGVMTDLRPAALEEFGLVSAVRWHASQFAKRTGMKVAMRNTGRELRLPRDQELALFRIVQEALTNAAKHSGGSSIDIAVSWRQGRLRLTVADDGGGFQDAAGARSARRGGFGLPTMRERAESLGGTLSIEFPGKGTRLVVELPLQTHGD
jgi:PAS domain S-box-containing protein